MREDATTADTVHTLLGQLVAVRAADTICSACYSSPGAIILQILGRADELPPEEPIYGTADAERFEAPQPQR